MVVFALEFNICLFCGLDDTYAYVAVQKIVWVMHICSNRVFLYTTFQVLVEFFKKNSGQVFHIVVYICCCVCYSYVHELFYF